MAMTTEQLLEIRERVEKVRDFSYTPQGIMCDMDTLLFLGKSKSDVPDLLDEVERLQSELELSNKIIDSYQQEIIPGFRERAEAAEQERGKSQAQIKEVTEHFKMSEQNLQNSQKREAEACHDRMQLRTQVAVLRGALETIISALSTIPEDSEAWDIAYTAAEGALSAIQTETTVLGLSPSNAKIAANSIVE